MTNEDYEVVVTLLDGDARELSRTFESGRLHPPFSVGREGDWIVAAEGVAGVHFWLQFDGRRLYAACAPGTTTYLQDVRIDKTRHEVADRSELRFGQARMKVIWRAPVVPRSVKARSYPPARVEPQRLSPAVRVEPSQLSPVERAAGLPLPDFFRDRTSAASVDSKPAYAEGRNLAGSAPGVVVRAGSGSFRARPAVPTWAVLLLPALALPLSAALLWFAISSHRAEVSAAVPAMSETTPEPASVPPRAAPVPLAEPPLDLNPVVESSAAPIIPSTPPPAPSRSSPLRAYRQDVTDKPVPRIGADPGTISEEWRAHHERQLHAPNRDQAKVIFLGDSITEAWGVAPAYRSRFGKYMPLNLGLAGDFTQNVLWRIDQGALTGTNPDVVVLMIGINNLAGGFSPPETVAGVRAILAAVQAHLPNTRVLLLEILPARESPADPLRQRIIEANRLLAALPASPRVSVQDVGSVLLEADGTLSKATTRDFLHPSAMGYERLSEAVAPLIDTLMAHASE